MSENGNGLSNEDKGMSIKERLILLGERKKKIEEEKDIEDEYMEEIDDDDYYPDYSPTEEIDTTPPVPRGKRKPSNFFIFLLILGVGYMFYIYSTYELFYYNYVYNRAKSNIANNNQIITSKKIENVNSIRLVKCIEKQQERLKNGLETDIFYCNK